jgi:hypothetical protein
MQNNIQIHRVHSIPMRCIAIFLEHAWPRRKRPRYTHGWQDSPEPLPRQTAPQLASGQWLRRPKACDFDSNGANPLVTFKHLQNLQSIEDCITACDWTTGPPNSRNLSRLKHPEFPSLQHPDDSERLWRSVGRSQVGAAPILVQSRSCQGRGTHPLYDGLYDEPWQGELFSHTQLVGLASTSSRCSFTYHLPAYFGVDQGIRYTHTHFGWLRAPLLLVEPLVLADIEAPYLKIVGSVSYHPFLLLIYLNSPLVLSHISG